MGRRWQENVSIVIEEDGSKISIVDDGIGMTVDDINKKYLRVGYRRRVEDPETGSRTKKDRPVMGRKGLGKTLLILNRQKSLKSSRQRMDSIMAFA